MITPFSISPNPSALFLTPSLKAAIHKVNYTIKNRQGLACIFGDAGLGKSSVLRYIAGAYDSEEDVVTGFITEPETSSPYAFVRGICQAFDLPGRRSLMDQKNSFKDFIFEQARTGKNVVMFLDEAQGLDSTMLETVRSFLNFESNKAKLLQIVLSGQLELRSRLNKPSNRAIKSRIIMYSLLDPLTLSETKAMIAHRCEMAEIDVPFSAEVIEQIYNEAGGVPRDILRLCANAYELSQLLGEDKVSAALVADIIQKETAMMAEEVTA